MFFRKTFSAFFVFAILLCAGVGAVFAQTAQTTTASHAVLIDLETDTVLLEKDAQARMPTSSMSKVMTMYLVFQALEDGRLKMDDTMTVSERAWRKGGSKMFVEVGRRVGLEDLIRGVIVQSGNDATIVLAEGISGTEEAFAQSMTQQAHAMGMKNSNFKNASGWPDPDHYSTGHDLALLARRIISDFPQYYHYYSETEFTYNDIKQPNRNPLLYRNIGADGIKTGHTRDAGYGLMASAVRNGRRLILVVNGLESEAARADEAARLIEWGFRSFESRTLLEAGEIVDEAPVWMGVMETVPLASAADIFVTVPAAETDRARMRVTVSYDAPVAAPVKKGDVIGVLKVDVPGLPPREFPLIAAADIGELGLFARTLQKARHLLLSRL
ncbi:MAG: D-alanyl-D-alanine carboxypeptidase [Micavibrio sp.]|nr:MAG: D-alanyl-D-alanine carboxypeptidase [Micavibrio sp.]